MCLWAIEIFLSLSLSLSPDKDQPIRGGGSSGQVFPFPQQLSRSPLLP